MDLNLRGLFEKLFPQKAEEQKVDGYFKTLTAYSPSFTSYDGGLYEMDLTRAAIHAFATQVSKLKPEITGGAKKNLERQLQHQPNPYMDTSKFLYRIATILSVNNTAFIVPIHNGDIDHIVGYYPILPARTEIVEVSGEPWLRYTFVNGNKAAIELDRVGIMTQYQYKDDFFGESNEPMQPTMELMHMQNQGMQDAIKQSANIRFAAKLGQTLRPEDIEAERRRFSKQNLSSDNKSGVMMFDSKYSEVNQIDNQHYVVDAEQMNTIKNNVFNYFGVNEDILQNKFDEDTWNAYYEGKIEPFATQLGLVMTNMTFTRNEIGYGNGFLFSANRMQYASNTTKLDVSTQLFDRGILTTNDVMDIWNMPHVEDGDKRYIRREYVESEKLDNENGGDDPNATENGEGVQGPNNLGTDELGNDGEED